MSASCHHMAESVVFCPKVYYQGFKLRGVFMLQLMRLPKYK